jgi:hypothetical protein
VDSRPVPPAFGPFVPAFIRCADFGPDLGAGLAARVGVRFAVLFRDVLAAGRRFEAADLFCGAFLVAARTDFRALVEPLLPFFGAALRGAFFAIGISLTERP